MRSILLGVFLLLMLGFLAGVWFLFATGAPVALEGGLSVTPAGTGGAAEMYLGDVVRVQDATSKRVQGAAQEQGEDAEQSAMDAREVFAFGTVVGPGGQALADARILLGSFKAGIALPLDIEGKSDNFRGEVLRTTSAAEGGFEFAEGPQGRRVSLVVRAAGHVTLYRNRIELSGEAPHDLGVIQLNQGARLAGRVVDPHSRGVSGVQILRGVERGVGGSAVKVIGRGIPLGSSGENGEFVVDGFDVGDWRLVFDAQGYQVVELSGSIDDVSSAHSDLFVSLVVGAEVSGSLIDAPADRYARWRVEARIHEEEGQRPGTSQAQRGVGDGAPATSPADARRVRTGKIEPDGRFRIGGLLPGSNLRLLVTELEDDDAWERVRSMESADVLAGSKGVELHYRSPSRLSFLVVSETSGKPLEELSLWITDARGRRAIKEGEGDEERMQRHFAGGRVVLEDLDMPDDGGKFALRVRAPGHSDHELSDHELSAGEAGDLGTITMKPTASVQVRVSDARTAEPIAGASILVAAEGNRALTWWIRSEPRKLAMSEGLLYAVTNSEGLATVDLIQGKACQVRVGADRYLSSKQQPVSAMPGISVIEIELHLGGEVRVLVTGPAGLPIAGESIERRKAGEVSRWSWGGGQAQETDQDGVALFGPLEPGVYEFRLRSADRSRRASADEPAWMPATVVEGQTTELRIQAPGHGDLTVVVFEGRDPLVGAALNINGVQAPSRNGMNWGLSNTEGRYTFQGLRCGSYTLSVVHPSRRMPHDVLVDVHPDGNEVRVVLTVAIIEGRVTDSEGQPLSGIQITVREIDRKGGAGGAGASLTLAENEEGRLEFDWQRLMQSMDVRTDVDGRYSLRGVVIEKRIEIGADADWVVGHKIKDLVLQADEVRADVNFRLGAAGSILVGMESGFRGSRVSAVRVEPQVKGGGTSASQRVRRSTVTLKGLAPGRWKVTLNPGRSNNAKFEPIMVDVEAGRAAKVFFRAL